MHLGLAPIAAGAQIQFVHIQMLGKHILWKPGSLDADDVRCEVMLRRYSTARQEPPTQLRAKALTSRHALHILKPLSSACMPNA